jgi:hypothetical protein
MLFCDVYLSLYTQPLTSHFTSFLIAIRVSFVCFVRSDWAPLPEGRTMVSVHYSRTLEECFANAPEHTSQVRIEDETIANYQRSFDAIQDSNGNPRTLLPVARDCMYQRVARDRIEAVPDDAIIMTNLVEFKDGRVIRRPRSIRIPLEFSPASALSDEK